MHSRTRLEDFSSHRVYRDTSPDVYSIVLIRSWLIHKHHFPRIHLCASTSHWKSFCGPRGSSEGISGGHQVSPVLQKVTSPSISLRACAVAFCYITSAQEPLYSSLSVYPLAPATFSIPSVYFFILLSNLLVSF